MVGGIRSKVGLLDVLDTQAKGKVKKGGKKASYKEKKEQKKEEEWITSQRERVLKLSNDEIMGAIHRVQETEDFDFGIDGEIDISAEDDFGFLNEESVAIGGTEVFGNAISQATPVQYAGLGDLLFESLDASAREQAAKDKMSIFTPETLKLFEETAVFLSRYKSGKIPKSVALIPNLKNWLDVLWLCKPDNWTPHAVAAVTRMFINMLNDNHLRKFMTYVVLPAVQRNIQQTGKVNVHLFQALQKCLYKPSVFFKGIYFPVVLDPGCDYRHAVILSSVIGKTSFPSVHAAAALLRMCQTPDPSNQLYYCILHIINKKHDMPENAIEIVAAWFNDFKSKQYMPVIWHQCLLCFVQVWKYALSEARIQDLIHLTKIQTHPHVSPQIRKELMEALDN